MYHSCKNFLQNVVRRFNDTHCLDRAASLTFTSLLSLVPLMLVSFTILAAFPASKSLGIRIQSFIFANFVATSGNVIQKYLQSFVAHAFKLSTVSLIFLLITAITLMFTLEQTLNTIWKVHKARHWLSAFLLYATILILSPLLLGAGFAISSYLLALSTTVVDLSKPLLAITPFLLSILAFTLVYVAVPNCKVPLRYGLYGAIIAAVLFELAKYFFALYVDYFPTYQILYGALAAIPIFLIWVYLCWVITLIGAVVSNVLAKRNKHKL